MNKKPFIIGLFVLFLLITINHKKQTDEEQYKEIKKLNKQNPDVFMNADEWKRKRLIEIKKSGLRWSK